MNQPAQKPVSGKKKLSKKTLLIAAVAVLAVAWFGYRRLNGVSAPVMANSDPTPTVAVRGNISSIVTGSGAVQPIEKYTIVSLVSGDILSDFVSVGDEVTKDQLLYVLDSSSAQTNIEKAQISLQQQELSYQQTQDSVQNLTVTMPISGILQNFYVKEGDSVNAGGRICDIVNTSELTVKLPFHSSDADNIYIGQPATIYLEESGDSITGRVTAKATGSTITDAGNIVTQVTLSFANPGAVVQNASATAIVGDCACSASGLVEYGAAETVMAKSSGDIVGLTKSQGDAVSSGEVLFTLDNPSLIVNSKSGALSLQTAQLSLTDSYKSLDNYNITSPISGQIISKSYKAGDTLDSNRTELAVVADMSRLTFTMSIDELDVKSLRVGQRVEVIADAMDDVVFDGYIESIGIMGSGSGGVTTYPVEVIIEEYEGLLPGMNVTADIVTAEAQNVIQVPVSAVARGNVVLITKEYADQIGATYPESTGGGQMSQNGSGSADTTDPTNSTDPADTTDPIDTTNPTEPVTDPTGGVQAVPPGGGEGMTRPEGVQPGSRPEGMSRPEGGGLPEGMSIPEGASLPEGVSFGGTGGGRQIQIVSNVQAPGTLVQRSDAPEGFVWLKVETGMSDGNMIEITAGLAEGATIYIMPGTISGGNTGFYMGGSATGAMPAGERTGGGQRNVVVVG